MQHQGRGDVHLAQLDGIVAILKKHISKDTLFSNLSCSLGTLMGCGHGERPKSSSTVAITVCWLCIANSNYSKSWNYFQDIINDTENFSHTPKFTEARPP